MMSRHQNKDGKKKSSVRRDRKPSNTFNKKANTKNINSSQSTSTNSDEIRLNKYIANSGICSRRDADMHISIGSVTVNGKVITEMGYKVKLEDDVRFDGSRITPERKTYVLLNKPKGFATTTSENKGKTVMDLVANATNARIKPIGRLGRNSTGLLLFTNDEKVVNRFTNSKQGVARLFEIELDKNLKFEDLKKIEKGLKIHGKLISVEEVSYIEDTPKNHIGLKIKNTGNSILHTIFDELKYDIVRVDCVAIGHLTKKDLPRGHWKHLTQQEINTLNML